ncbi:CBD9-like protein [Serendipita vermifera]|nr:CBD9-like protein [Serendipita vermifera]
MKLEYLFIFVSSAALFVRGQESGEWCDSVTDICFQRFHDPDRDVGYGFIFPPNKNTTEFIGIFTAPVQTGWTGVCLGSDMRNNLLLVGWMNDGEPVMSSRFSTSWNQPLPYSGPQITVLSTSGTNDTYQRFLYRCQNCTSWNGRSISIGDFNIFGYGTNVTQGSVDEPSNPDSDFRQHDWFGLWGIDFSSANSSSYYSYLDKYSLNTSVPSQLASQW